MKTIFPLWVRSSLFIFLASLVLFTACLPATGDEHDHDHEHEHEAIGLRVYTVNLAGLKDQLVAEQTLKGVTSSITISGETSLFTIVFIDDDAHEFTPDLSEHSIDVEAAEDADNLLITRPNESDNNITFALKGLKGTSAKINIILKHQGAKEFVSKPLHVTINL
ncbi:MAG: hypothetical protein WC967_08445 [Balneolaceae bacterium]